MHTETVPEIPAQTESLASESPQQSYGYSGFERSMEPHLRRVAILHGVADDPFALDELGERYGDVSSRKIHISQNQGYIIEKASNPGVPESLLGSKDSAEKSATLAAVRSALLMASAAHASESAESGSKDVDWRGTSNTLLDIARKAGAENQSTLFVAAVLASQMSKDPADRADFFESVYSDGLQRQVADACKQSHLVVIHTAPGTNERGIYHPGRAMTVRQMSKAFVLDPSEALDYVQRIRPRSLQDELPSAKAMQKRLSEPSQVGQSHEVARERAKDVSLNSERTHNALIDPYKIERFALEQKFIADQMGAVIGSDPTSTPLARALRDSRSSENNIVSDESLDEEAVPSIDLAVAKLEADLNAAFIKLSQPVIAMYAVNREVSAGYAGLDERQSAALRFRDISGRIEKTMDAARFIDVEQFVERDRNEMVAGFEAESEIWGAAADGAAAPDVIGRVIAAGVSQAVVQPEIEARADELRDALHVNRRELLATATYNIADFPQAQVGEGISLGRSEDGKLQLNLRFRPPGGKDAADVYAAITLGCPALRVIHGSRSELNMAAKLAHGSSNYIDHVLAVAINEAYERGILDTDNFADNT